MNLWLIFCLITSNNAIIVNIAVNRSVDITTQTTKELVEIIFRNLDEAPVTVYSFSLIPEDKDYFLEFSNAEMQKLHHQEHFKENNTFIVYLDKSVEGYNSYKLFAAIFSINKVKPALKSRTFKKTQLLEYKGNVYFYSPYKTSKSSVQYDCKSDDPCVVSYLPHSRIENKLLYSYSNVVPYSVKEVDIYFANNNPLYAVTSLERILYVSHWGRILIEDHITLKNIGSQLKGPYEPSFAAKRPWLYTHLPASSEDIKYFDELGNNSKSEVIYYQDHITLKYQARYPLSFGGWKAPYILQYKVPTYEYLQKRKDLFYLRIRAIDHIVNDGYIEQAVVKILLPEGAVIKKINAPEWFNVSEEMHFTDLCFFGRETAVLNGKMLMETHIADVSIIYELPDFWLLETPILLMMYLLIVFIFIIIVNRLKLL